MEWICVGSDRPAPLFADAADRFPVGSKLNPVVLDDVDSQTVYDCSATQAHSSVMAQPSRMGCAHRDESSDSHSTGLAESDDRLGGASEPRNAFGEGVAGCSAGALPSCCAGLPPPTPLQHSSRQPMSVQPHNSPMPDQPHSCAASGLSAKQWQHLPYDCPTCAQDGNQMFSCMERALAGTQSPGPRQRVQNADPAASSTYSGDCAPSTHYTSSDPFVSFGQGNTSAPSCASWSNGSGAQPNHTSPGIVLDLSACSHSSAHKLTSALRVGAPQCYPAAPEHTPSCTSLPDALTECGAAASRARSPEPPQSQDDAETTQDGAESSSSEEDMEPDLDADLVAESGGMVILSASGRALSEMASSGARHTLYHSARGGGNDFAIGQIVTSCTLEQRRDAITESCQLGFNERRERARIALLSPTAKLAFGCRRVSGCDKQNPHRGSCGNSHGGPSHPMQLIGCRLKTIDKQGVCQRPDKLVRVEHRNLLVGWLEGATVLVY